MCKSVTILTGGENVGNFIITDLHAEFQNAGSHGK